MAGVRRTLEFDQEGLAPGDNRGPMLHQPLVPERQLRVHGRRMGVDPLVAQIAQQPVTLCHHLLEGRQRAAVGAVDLAQGNVQVAAALAGGAVHQPDIFGQEEHGADEAHEIEPPPRRAVDLDLLGKIGAIGARGKQDLQIQRPGVSLDVAGDPAVGNRLRLRQPVDDLALGLGMHRLAGGEKKDRFEQVGFALGVLPLQQREPACQVQLETLVVTKMG